MFLLQSSSVKECFLKIYRPRHAFHLRTDHRLPAPLPRSIVDTLSTGHDEAPYGKRVSHSGRCIAAPQRAPVRSSENATAFANVHPWSPPKLGETWPAHHREFSATRLDSRQPLS